MIGQVRSFNDEKGYGFVSFPSIVDEEVRFFAHYREIWRMCRCGFRCKSAKGLQKHVSQCIWFHVPKSRLHTGEYVVFEPCRTSAGGKADRAIDIRGLNDGCLMCDVVDIRKKTIYGYANSAHFQQGIASTSAPSEKTIDFVFEKVEGQIPQAKGRFPIFISKDKNWGSASDESIADALPENTLADAAINDVL